MKNPHLFRYIVNKQTIIAFSITEKVFFEKKNSHLIVKTTIEIIKPCFYFILYVLLLYMGTPFLRFRRDKYTTRTRESVPLLFARQFYSNWRLPLHAVGTNVVRMYVYSPKACQAVKKTVVLQWIHKVFTSWKQNRTV